MVEWALGSTRSFKHVHSGSAHSGRTVCSTAHSVGFAATSPNGRGTWGAPPYSNRVRIAWLSRSMPETATTMTSTMQPVWP